VDTLRDIRRVRRLVRVGAPDPRLTSVSGMVAVSELTGRLGVVDRLDAAIGPIKSRRRGHTGGELLVGMAGAQLAGEEFLVGLDRQRADVAGQMLAPVAGLCSTTAAALARRLRPGQWHAVETGIGDVHTAMLDMLAGRAPDRAQALAREVTIDLDATDVEVYGRLKRGVAYNYQGQRCGRPHVATWAQTCTVLAADLLAGNEDPRAGCAGLLYRAMAALPAQARDQAVISLRADGGYFAGQLARAALAAEIGFAIGAHRIAPLWRALAGLTESDWAPAIDMLGAEVAVADYTPGWWPADTALLIRRVRLDPTSALSSDPRTRRRRTLHPDQRALPLGELADAGRVYGYSFILTNLDVSTPERAAIIEHWYRHRTEIENLFRDSKIGAALRHLPSGYPQVNRAWMWAALLAASIAGWLHQLTATPTSARLVGHGERGGQAMIATLRHRLIRVPARLIQHAGQLTLRLPPDHQLLPEILTRIRALPTAS
jgi:hypothetical protein